MSVKTRSSFAGEFTHKTPDETLELDARTGNDVARMSFECEWDNAITVARSYPTYPSQPQLKISKGVIERIEGARAKVTLTFEGVGTLGTSGTVDDTRVYSLEGTLATEPIETHEDFDTFGGTFNSPNTTNGAHFADDGTGAFLGFYGGSVPSANKNCKRGVTSYLAPALVYSENITVGHGSISSSRVSINKLGKIDSPPSSSVLPEVGSRTWLLASVSVENVGSGARSTRSWRLSGPRGWDTDIY